MYEIPFLSRIKPAAPLLVIAALFIFFIQFASADNSNVSVTIAITECSDGVDNDSDGLIDYPNDPDCDSLSDDDESTPPPPPTDPTPTTSTKGTSSGGGNNSSGFRRQVTDTDNLKTTISFTGQAYPGARISILRNGFKYLTTDADSDGMFKVVDSKANAGVYTFSIRAIDKAGRESVPVTFSIYIPTGRSIFADKILIPPTIELSSQTIKKDGTLIVSGEALPDTPVEIWIAGKNFEVTSNSSGVYQAKITPQLKQGDYAVKANVLGDDGVDRISTAILLRIGNVASFAEAFSSNIRGDIDGNGRVDLLDFSIMAYWYRQSAVPSHVDLTGDGKVDLRDMSILAYYWNG